MLVLVIITYPVCRRSIRLPTIASKIRYAFLHQDGVQIGEFGEERRNFVAIDKVPALMKQAILAAEDERFTSMAASIHRHHARNVSNLLSSQMRQGASTITQQVAKTSFFPANEPSRANSTKRC